MKKSSMPDELKRFSPGPGDWDDEDDD